MTGVAVAGAFVGRDFRIARSYRMAFAMTIAGIFATLLTFRFISELIDAEAVPSLKATNYFSFVVVGIALGQVLQGSLSGPTSAVRTEQVQGTLEILATQPISPWVLAPSWATYPVLDGLVQGSVMLTASALMGFQTTAPQWGTAALGILLAAIVFASLGILGAAFVLVFQQGGVITQWITSGLSLISGVFFPVEDMPGWLGALAELSPLTHILRVVRGALLSGQGVGDLAGELLILAAFAAVLPFISVGALTRALGRARRRGTISTY